MQFCSIECKRIDLKKSFLFLFGCWSWSFFSLLVSTSDNGWLIHQTWLERSRSMWHFEEGSFLCEAAAHDQWQGLWKYAPQHSCTLLGSTRNLGQKHQQKSVYSSKRFEKNLKNIWISWKHHKIQSIVHILYYVLKCCYEFKVLEVLRFQ